MARNDLNSGHSKGNIESRNTKLYLIEKCRDRIWNERKGVLAKIDTPDFINKSKGLGISEGMTGIGLFLLCMEVGTKNLNKYL